MTQKVIEVDCELEMASQYVIQCQLEPMALGPWRMHDYNRLYNKPKFNGITLEGDKRFSDIGITFASYDETMKVLNS